MMRERLDRLRTAGTAIVLASVAVACSSNAPPVPTGIPTCPPLPLPSQLVYLAYPANGATSIPTSLGRVVVGDFNATLATFGGTIVLSKSSGTAQSPIVRGVPGPVPSPLPSPLATGALTSTPVYAGLPIPALAPATTYAVSYDYTFEIESPRCQSDISQQLGTFTTQ